MFTRVVRMPEADEVSNLVAQRLLDRLIELQDVQPIVHVCLTGGNAANAMYEWFAELAEGSDLDAAKLQLWWGDERFVLPRTRTATPCRPCLGWPAPSPSSPPTST